ncbi:DNA methyltransferase [Campylobacter taeniopygiae]|uniref:site-specific DNA-methyltransferase (adenine-specific) n=1 Tax=Campylobacter taeniopygiae TaxID=2510188 RepID=A0ABY2TLA3_9BACT|nr:site-specific DNA-methyltransferase [Campylobacter taeniopygiae]TKX34647.1 site-specific DNA-methyltransferase [Campylobacter taeniopygiae]
MNFKQAFYSKLEDCYLGAKIKYSKNQTKNGFTNLLSIKEKYFQKIKEYLDTQKIYTNTYNKLYNFFSSYLNETGTPFFYDTPIYKNIYAKVYSNSKDTNLFYKTQNLYYVKSDTIYNPLSLQSDEYTFNFLTDEYVQNPDNNKNKINFYLQDIRDNNINIKVINSKNSDYINIFKQNSNEFSDDFLKFLKKENINIKEEELKKLFKSYKKQNEVDFFIHKDARNFLKEQFNLWLFFYVNDSVTDWTKQKIEDINSLKQIAFKIIDYIADFEDELKAIWLKPKFAKNTHYVFSIDTIKTHANNADKILKTIYKDTKFKDQITEWQELKFIEDDFDIKNIDEEKYKFLPLDTKYLSEENYYKLLSSFENLDEILNGELIKSDNFQALNSLMPKYQNKIDLIYIDPPFNTGSDFEYKDKFQDSTWLSLMHNRLELAKEFLSDRGSFYLHLDENADYRGKELLNEIFHDMECKKITFNTNATKDNESDLFGYKSFGNNFVLKSSTILFIKNENSIFNKLWKPNRNASLLNLGQLDLIGIPKTQTPKKIIDYEYYIQKWDDGKLHHKKIDIKDEKIYPLSDIWNDLYSFTQSEMRVSENISFYSSQKPENMLRRIIQSSSNENNIVMDFFAGSGTTLAVAHKLNRKFVGIEMGKHFYEKYLTFDKESKQYEYRLGLLGRMKNVIAGDIEFYAIDKKRRSSLSKIIEFKGGGAFRYYELESYEESLNECEYALNENTIIDYRKSKKLIKGLKKGENICLDMNAYNKEFDIFLTMSNLLGLKIKNIFIDKNGIKSCKFENDEVINLENIDLIQYPKLKNLIWWENHE